VDDSYALENTLSRIRQRYALFFNLPAGARRGEKRAIEISLTDALRQRYPSAEVRYRRLYLAPVDGGPRDGEPTTRTQAPLDGPSANRDVSPRRRPVGDTPISRQGPLDMTGGPAATPPSQPPPSATPPQSVWRPADPQAGKPVSSENKSADAPPAQGGWRKATPEELRGVNQK